MPHSRPDYTLPPKPEYIFNGTSFRIWSHPQYPDEIIIQELVDGHPVNHANIKNCELQGVTQLHRVLDYIAMWSEFHDPEVIKSVEEDIRYLLYGIRPAFTEV